MKGLFLLLAMSCDLNINTIPLALVAEFIDAISLSEEPSSPNQSSTPSHHAISSSTNLKKHCSAHNATVPPSKVTFRLWMDEKKGISEKD